MQMYLQEWLVAEICLLLNVEVKDNIEIEQNYILCLSKLNALFLVFKLVPVGLFEPIDLVSH